eukprot:2478848-Prymnesium_polylepis.1
MARAAAPAMQNARAQPPRTRACAMRTRSHQRAGRQAGAGGLGWMPRRGGGERPGLGVTHRRTRPSGARPATARERASASSSLTLSSAPSAHRARTVGDRAFGSKQSI